MWDRGREVFASVHRHEGTSGSSSGIAPPQTKRSLFGQSFLCNRDGRRLLAPKTAPLDLIPLLVDLPPSPIHQRHSQSHTHRGNVPTAPTPIGTLVLSLDLVAVAASTASHRRQSITIPVGWEGGGTPAASYLRPSPTSMSSSSSSSSSSWPPLPWLQQRKTASRMPSLRTSSLSWLTTLECKI